MLRSPVRSIVRAAVIALMAVVGGATVGLNIHLLTERPIIARAIPEPVPPRWLCGRVSGPSYCVAISERDRRWLDRASLGFLLCFPLLAVVAADEVQALRSRPR